MMDLNNQHILVVGLAKSGISTLKALKQLNAHVTINDIKTEEALADFLLDVEGLFDEAILGKHPADMKVYDMVVLSPGVPTDLPFIQAAQKAGIDICGELELAYRINPACRYIGITGTNGKTSTTTLTGEIFKAFGSDTRVVGNIGLPVISQVFDATEKTVMVTEISSFQLETIRDFRASVAAVLNVTPDHLNRHKTMENYTDAKAAVFKNQTSQDALVLNYDNDITRQLGLSSKCKTYFFSHAIEPEQGMFVRDGVMVFRDHGIETPIMEIDKIFIPGKHNLENAMAAALIAILSGVDVQTIAATIAAFKGVAHRIEFVDEIEGISFYNDSKGTNPDASVQAVKAMNRPTVLIAGGMDKGSVFGDLIDVFGTTIKHLVLLGETKQQFADEAKAKGFNDVTLVKDMDEAVEKAFELAEKNSSVLLSPACASWDMYPNFETRGDHFKNCVGKIRGRLHG